MKSKNPATPMPASKSAAAPMITGTMVKNETAKVRMADMSLSA